MTSHNRFKASDVLWIALELTAPLLIVGAIIVWAIDRFRGETFVGG
jgi:hypothetical protein